MPLVTGPNITLTNAWVEIASGQAQVLIQLLGSDPAVIAFGSAAPAAESTSGHVVQAMSGRDTFGAAGLTTEKVYARSLRNLNETAIAVSKG